MKILFISFDADPPYMGGTSTVVNVLAKYFKRIGHEIALGYFEDSEHPSVFFENKIKLVKENYDQAKLFILNFEPDIIYNTQAMSTDFSFLKSLPIHNSVLISAYHNKPLLRYYPIQSLINLYYDSNNILYKIYTLAKIPLLPFWKYKSQKNELKKFKIMVEESDKIQLLSQKFIPSFRNIIPYVKEEKIETIGNPIVFNSLLPINELPNKHKKVVVVCSTNYQKRASLMIKIWAQIEKDTHFSDWSFDFIGEGEEFNKIVKLTKNLKLKRINFLGYQNPELYYKQSSIFLMTSRFEGWPMVLMEAMQMGVVPIVFNSFESLPDIVTDKHNGLIIPNNDITQFVKQLKWLMINNDKRYLIAKNAINSCKKFSIENIAQKYLSMFEKCISDSNTQKNKLWEKKE